MENNQALTKLSDLPILKHLEGGENKLKVLPENMANWKKGEKSIAWLVGLVLILAVGYGFITVLLPLITSLLVGVITLGFKMIEAMVVVGAVLLGFMLSPLIFKVFRRIVRSLHKLLIRIDPFAELDDQLGKMKDSRREFETVKAEINACKIQMKQEAVKAEKLAKDASQKVVYCQEEAKVLKAKLDKMLEKRWRRCPRNRRFC